MCAKGNTKTKKTSKKNPKEEVFVVGEEENTFFFLFFSHCHSLKHTFSSHSSFCSELRSDGNPWDTAFYEDMFMFVTSARVKCAVLKKN